LRLIETLHRLIECFVERTLKVWPIWVMDVSWSTR